MKTFATYYDGTATDETLDCLLASATNDGLMSKEDKVKLDSLTAGGGTVESIEASKVIEDETHRFVTDTDIAAWDAKAETKEDLELGNVTNDAQVKRTEMGVAGGVATLDDAGKVPAAQLPGFVDDVEEYTAVSAFPVTGEAGKLYVDTTENKTYRWSGTQYTEISAGGLALGETSATAYAGDKGKANADAIAAITNGTTVVPKAADAATVNGFTVAVNVPADAVFTDTDTVYTHPENHPATMIVEDETHRFVTDEEKATWNATEVATETADGLMAAADKVKLNTVAENANCYVHPETHAATDVTEDETHRFVSDEEKETWNLKADCILASENTDGLMAKDDKVKLDKVFVNEQTEPYFDEATGCFFACGVGVVAEASETLGMNKITWVSKEGPKSIEVPADILIYGGGDAPDHSIDYLSTSITINSGAYKVIYGGTKGNGNVASATIVVNGGTFREGINGAGAGYIGKDCINSVGHVNIIVNNSDNEMSTVFGGGQGRTSVVGNTKITVNGGSISWLTAGGSNGHTGYGEVVVNGGTVKVLQGCNRGTMGNIKLTVNGGTVNKVYAGGETEDTGVTATYIKSEVAVNGGTITAITAGTNGGVENADTVSGTYVHGVITDEAATAMNLAKLVTLDKLTAVLEDKILLLKVGNTVVTSVDLTPVTL